MLQDRDDFTLLARAGRVPHQLRAGPSGRLRPVRADPRRRVRPGRPGPALRALARRLPLPSRRRGLDRGEYLELEFAVGFGAEDDQLS